jgi:hypothetical protein
LIRRALGAGGKKTVGVFHGHYELDKADIVFDKSVADGIKLYLVKADTGIHCYVFIGLERPAFLGQLDKEPPFILLKLHGDHTNVGTDIIEYESVYSARRVAIVVFFRQ